MSRARRFNTPKRAVYKEVSTIRDLQIPAAEETIVLHTSDERETLTRIKGRLILNLSANAAVMFTLGLVIVINPLGVNCTAAATVTQGNLTAIPQEEIARFVMGAGTLASQLQDAFEFDIKSQRKMREGTTLSIKYIGSEANDGALTVAITHFWKEV